MTDTTPTSTPPATIDDQRKAAKPALPQNLKTWAMLGLAAVIVLMVFLSGSSSPKGAASAAPATASRSTSEDLQRSLASGQAEQQRLAQEIQQTQAEIARTKAANEGLADAATAGLGPGNMSAEDAAFFQRNQGMGQGGPGAPNERAAAADQLAAERQKREYQSLFSSSVARTYRQAPSVAPQARGGEEEGVGGQRPTEAAMGAQAAQDTQPGSYRLLEGTVLEAALVNRINTDFAGPVIAQVTTDILSPDRRRVLIPAGSRILGEAKATQATGQTRAAVVFHRIIRPDGYSVSLDMFPGLDGLGDTGLKDKTNNHYFKIFGASIAVGALGGLSAFGTRSVGLVEGVGALDEFRQGAAGGTGSAATRILDRFLNIPPTITIREGHRIRVYLLKDVSLPPYEAAL